MLEVVFVTGVAVIPTFLGLICALFGWKGDYHKVGLLQDPRPKWLAGGGAGSVLVVGGVDILAKLKDLGSAINLDGALVDVLYGMTFVVGVVFYLILLSAPIVLERRRLIQEFNVSLPSRSKLWLEGIQYGYGHVDNELKQFELVLAEIQAEREDMQADWASLENKHKTYSALVARLIQQLSNYMESDKSHDAKRKVTEGILERLRHIAGKELFSDVRDEQICATLFLFASEDELEDGDIERCHFADWRDPSDYQGILGIVMTVPGDPLLPRCFALPVCHRDDEGHWRSTSLPGAPWCYLDRRPTLVPTEFAELIPDHVRRGIRDWLEEQGIEAAVFLPIRERLPGSREGLLGVIAIEFRGGIDEQAMEDVAAEDLDALWSQSMPFGAALGAIWASESEERDIRTVLNLEG